MDKTNEFTVKVQTNNELTEKQIEALIDKMFFSDEKIFYAERITISIINYLQTFTSKYMSSTNVSLHSTQQ